MAPLSKTGPLVWMDLEMTGLDPETCTILEIATVITDDELNVVAEGPELVIHHPDAVLDAMDEWNTKHHGESGLIDRVKASTVSLAEAEAQTLAFIKEHCEERTGVLSGNSVWQDRRFLTRHMPQIEAYLHYRIVDVSSLKVLIGRWYGGKVKAPPKAEAHRAKGDILESIKELRHYRETVFRKP